MIENILTVGDMVIHISTKECGIVTGQCLSHTKVKVDFYDGNSNYPTPIRNLKKMEVIEWLQNNKESLSIRGIERQLDMPDSTLIKAVNGSQELPKKWRIPLAKFINNLVKL